MTLIYAVVIFLLLIFVHEFGHFIAAKACGVKVNEFALGMGPEIISKQGKETKYAIRAIPFGGYCMMEGEEEDSDDERSLNNKNGFQKFIVFSAGALMNALLALIIMILISLISGMPTTTIDSVDGPAAKAGMEKGDILISIDEKEIREWNDVGEALFESKGEEVEVVYDRDGKTHSVKIVPEYNKEQERYMLGVVSRSGHNPVKACSAGAKATWAMTTGMYHVLAQLFTGEVSTKELSGPVGIVSIVNKTSKMGFVYVAYLTALISLNLAIMNLLPFPALDGGRILFLVIRKITGKRVTDEMENRFHIAGMILLFMLMIFITFQDVGRLIG